MVRTVGKARTLLVCVVAVMAAGCATAFSPAMIRDEIVRQRGENPRRAFEVTLGRFTTLLFRQLAGGDGEEVPFEGLAGLELAVFEVEAGDGPALDVTRIRVRGWEPLLRLADGARSGMVLVRGGRGAWRASARDAPRIADLVVVGSGPRQVVYARLWGSLEPGLPRALGDVLRDDGPAGVRRVLSGLAASGGAGPEE